VVEEVLPFLGDPFGTLATPVYGEIVPSIRALAAGREGEHPRRPCREDPDLNRADFDGWQHVTPFQKAGVPTKTFERRTWGGEFNPEFGPQEGDVVVYEHWVQSGLANTDLDAQLKQHGIQKVILVGLIANSCIESTGRYWMELGYM
jgi:nicotinamidase-related amidase